MFSQDWKCHGNVSTFDTDSALLRIYQVVSTDQIDTVPRPKNLEQGRIKGYCLPNKEPFPARQKFNI